MPHNVRVLAAVSAMQDASSKMVYPVLPLFLVGVLGAPPVAVGIVEGVADATSAVAKLVAGGLGDRRRRAPLVRIGYGLAAVGKVLLAVATVWPVVLLARFVDRIGKGVRAAPRDALIADSTDPQRLGAAYGYHRSVEKAGAAVGPLIGLVTLIIVGDRLRTVLIIALVPGLIAWLLTWLARDHDRPVQSVTERQPWRTQWQQLGSPFRSTALPFWVFALINGSDAYLLLRASEIGLSVRDVVLVFVAHNLVYTLVARPIGALSDRMPRHVLLAAGLVVFAATFAGLGVADETWMVWPLFAGYAVFGALTDGVAKAAIVDVVAADRRSSALGLFHAGNGVGALVAGLWIGLAWGADGSLPLIVAGCAAMPVAVWMLSAGRRRSVTATP
jgi:MFS family permease